MELAWGLPVHPDRDDEALSGVLPGLLEGMLPLTGARQHVEDGAQQHHVGLLRLPRDDHRVMLCHVVALGFQGAQQVQSPGRRVEADAVAEAPVAVSRRVAAARIR